MTHTLKVVFGKEQVQKIYNQQMLTSEEVSIHLKEYQFKTEAEKQAFITGLNEALGWTDYCIPQEILLTMQL